MNLREQGLNAWRIFHGAATSKTAQLVYGESKELFSQVIRENLMSGIYTLADLGSHRGEFLEDFIGALPEYKFKTIAVDVNIDDLNKNHADQIVVSELFKLELPDKSVDISFARYALAWNDIDHQKDILREIKRVTKKIAIIQHQGASDDNPSLLQNASMKLFGGEIPELNREEFFFSTASQLENIMEELDLDFKKVQDRKVSGLSDIFIEKYDLSRSDSRRVKEILRDSDYIQQLTWVIKF